MSPHASSSSTPIRAASPSRIALAAYRNAFLTDPTSAFGGIIAFNRQVDAATAEAVARQFVEVVIAPSYDQGALAVFAAQAERARAAALRRQGPEPPRHESASAADCLVQTSDAYDMSELRIVTKRDPSKAEMNDLVFAFRVAKFVKSNAIVFCRGGMTLGVGAGQMSRVDSTRIAAIKAKNANCRCAARWSLRCVLSRSATAWTSSRSGRARRDPAGRERARQGSHRRRRRARHRDGVHRHEALPPLGAAIKRNVIAFATLAGFLACLALLVYSGQRIFATIGPSRAMAMPDGSLYLVSHGKLHVFSTRAGA
jgi:AICAR transformylase/IMP cyclohydrolase PurH